MSKNKPNKSIWLVLLILAVAAVAGAAVLRGSRPGGAPKPPVQTGPVQTEPSAPADPIPSTAPAEQTPDVPELVLCNLGYGLEITDAGKYTGLYMEDGSNEVLSDVMMVVVRNSGGEDVQLANITALCGGEEYHFTLTNLAAGERVVLLEQERKPSAELTSAVLDTCALFGEPMSLYADILQISGLDGMVNVKNISDADITGDIHVYYKYAAQDILYGGITFRVRIEGGLKAGEIRQLPAGHYTKDGCAIVQVTIHE